MLTRKTKKVLAIVLTGAIALPEWLPERWFPQKQNVPQRR